MATPELPSFDLVVATVDRSDALTRLLASLERQTHRGLRVLLVDQNEDERLETLLATHSGLEIVRLRSPRGLSRARNAALPHLAAEIVAFPDDDCVYADDLLERLGRRFAAATELDGLSGRVLSADGRGSPNWNLEPAVLGRDNLWNRVNSAAIFLRRELVQKTGAFDERLGLGSGEAWSSGEEIDYLVRALAAGGRIEYDPALVIVHAFEEPDAAALRRLGLRDGASIGYVLRKHRYPARVVARMVVRPLGGVVLSLARRDPAKAGFHAANLRGRMLGYRRASSAKSAP